MPDRSTGDELITQTYQDLKELFKVLDVDGSGFLDQVEIGQAAERLGFPFQSDEALVSLG